MYGTQQPIALLKLLLERGGMYDRGKDLNWKVYKDIGFLAAMGKVHNLLLKNCCIHVITQLVFNIILTNNYVLLICSCVYIGMHKHILMHLPTYVCLILFRIQFGLFSCSLNYVVT